jgi:hypothetical protein
MCDVVHEELNLASGTNRNPRGVHRTCLNGMHPPPHGPGVPAPRAVTVRHPRDATREDQGGEVVARALWPFLPVVACRALRFGRSTRARTDDVTL